MASQTKKKKMSPQIRAQRISRARHIDGVLVDFATQTPEQERLADSFWGDVKPRICSHNAYRMSAVVQQATRKALEKHNETLGKDASGKPEAVVTSLRYVRGDIKLDRARAIAVASLCAGGAGVLEYLDAQDEIITCDLSEATADQTRAHFGAMFEASPHMGQQISQIFDAGLAVENDAKIHDESVLDALGKKDYACSLPQAQELLAGGLAQRMSVLSSGSGTAQMLTSSLAKLEDISAKLLDRQTSATN